MEQDKIRVRLDELKAIDTHSFIIAEALLKICGVSEIWDNPISGQREFLVREKPQDVPQAGVFWVESNLPTATDTPWFEGGEKNE